MEALGWIDSEWDTENVQGPPRKVFKLSEQGKAAHQTWQEELAKAQKSIHILLEPASEK
jgi:DNA-binding PadR family transcriptional regulator